MSVHGSGCAQLSVVVDPAVDDRAVRSHRDANPAVEAKFRALHPPALAFLALHRALLGGVVVFLDHQPLDQHVVGRAFESEPGSRGLDQLAGRIVDEMDPAGGVIEEEPVGRELCLAGDLLERLVVDEESGRERTGGMGLWRSRRA